jgi:hypothetical protein
MRGDTFIDTLTFAFSNPQVTGDVSPGPSTLNKKRYPVEAIVIR